MPKKIPIDQEDEEGNFVMQPLKTNIKPYYKERVSLKLKTVIKKKGKKNVGKCYPVFNDDGLPYTPTFLIDCDREAYEFLDEMLRNQYIQKLKNSQEKSTNLLTLEEQISTPEPNSKVCFVCKVNYTQYQKHIQQLGHKHNVKRSAYSSKIESLCSQYSLSNPIQKPQESYSSQPMLLQLTDELEKCLQVPGIPMLTPFNQFFEESSPIRYR